MGDNEDAVGAYGINVTWLKVSVFCISSFWVGVAGSFYAHLLGYVSPAIADFVTVMVMVAACTIIGGVGTFIGPLLGAFVMYPTSEIIRTYGAEIQQLIFALVILLALKFLRNGFAGLISSRKNLLQRINAKISKTEKNPQHVEWI
jgi:branched-chain amino acid transport system permease protein